MDTSSLSRRDFLAQGAAGAAAMTLGPLAFMPRSPRGANDRIGIALIGAGGRGQSLMDEIRHQGRDLQVALVGICDVWRLNRESAVRRATEGFGEEPFQTTDYREALEHPRVDAVVIATPDFGHSPILIDAARAGKDAYCEKPLSNTLEEANGALWAVRETGQVVQIGTQRRSEGRFRTAVEMVRSGLLGKISRITMSVNFNQARWWRDVSNVKGEDVDWRRYLMHLPDRPFDPKQFRLWHLYRDFTTGLPGLWMSHYIDLVPWFTGDPFPKSVVAHGGTYVWRDGREHADTFHALLEYPQGFLVSWSMGLGNAVGDVFTLHGTRGTMDCQLWKVSGEGGAGEGKIAAEKPVVDRGGAHHMRNWLECLRSRETPNAPIEAGYQHAVACVMAAHACWSGQRQIYDAGQQAIRAE